VIAEILLVLLISFITLGAIIYRKNAFATFLVNNLSATPPSQDVALETLLEIAGRYYAEKNYLSAEKAYLKVLKVDHKNSLAYSRLGFIYSHLGNTEDAIECFTIVADTYPNAASYHNLAMMYFKNRDFNKSAEALEKSLSMEMHFSRLINLARIYRAMNKFDLQLQTLKKAHELEPENLEAMQLLAEAYLHEKEEKAAKLLFKKILKLDPNNHRARAGLQPTGQLKKPN
jgi:tetratricopeptide (TPR) repeat protein